MNIIDEYFKLLDEVYNYFGFVEDWTVYPLDDKREFDWIIKDDYEVVHGAKEDVVNNTGKQYTDTIHKDRFYDKWIYRGKDYTMIMVDTHTDGNKFLSIYDNSKEIK